eukprot:14363946-Ditylum_brightwellii.AAC.2
MGEHTHGKGPETLGWLGIGNRMEIPKIQVNYTVVGSEEIGGGGIGYGVENGGAKVAWQAVPLERVPIQLMEWECIFFE